VIGGLGVVAVVCRCGGWWVWVGGRRVGRGRGRWEVCGRSRWDGIMVGRKGCGLGRLGGLGGNGRVRYTVRHDGGWGGCSGSRGVGRRRARRQRARGEERVGRGGGVGVLGVRVDGHCGGRSAPAVPPQQSRSPSVTAKPFPSLAGSLLTMGDVPCVRQHSMARRELNCT
jgi:hypothetical protein